VPALVSVLLYNPVNDHYTFVWKTSGAWAGTCRRLDFGHHPHRQLPVHEAARRR